MNVPVRLGVFGLALGVVFAGAYGTGVWTGPVAGSDRGGHSAADATTGHQTGGHGSTEQPATDGPGGLAVSAEGYTLRLVGANPSAGGMVHTASFTANAA
jgi:hypothetical protein